MAQFIALFPANHTGHGKVYLLAISIPDRFYRVGINRNNDEMLNFKLPFTV
jgi:hypothetical protein